MWGWILLFFVCIVVAVFIGVIVNMLYNSMFKCKECEARKRQDAINAAVKNQPAELHEEEEEI